VCIEVQSIRLVVVVIRNTLVEKNPEESDVFGRDPRRHILRER
jgi:hypothetical protein